MKITIKNLLLRFLSKIDSRGVLIFFIKRLSQDIYIQELPMLSENKIKFLSKAAQNSEVFLEFGSGSSTLYFANFAKQIVTVESDRRFLEAVKVEAINRKIENIIFVNANIGPIFDYGQPIPAFNWIARRLYSNYYFSPWTHLEKVGLPDLVFIDGRFRVMCALEVMLRCKNLETLIVIDDFRSRPEYQELLEVLEFVEYVDDAAVFKISEANTNKVKFLQNKYKFDFA
jgi:hypothetical protein